MKNLALKLLLIFTCINVGAKSRLVDAKSAKEIEINYKKLSADDGEWHLLKDQAFEIQLNSNKLKNVVFAPFVDTGIRFVLLSQDGKSILQTLPKSELAVTEIFSFQKIEAVSFKDINADGTLDILVLASYFDSLPAQGEGVGGGSTKVGFVFISNKDAFEMSDSCGEDVTTLAALEKCAKGSTKK